MSLSIFVSNLIDPFISFKSLIVRHKANRDQPLKSIENGDADRESDIILLSVTVYQFVETFLSGILAD